MKKLIFTVLLTSTFNSYADDKFAQNVHRTCMSYSVKCVDQIENYMSSMDCKVMTVVCGLASDDKSQEANVSTVVDSLTAKETADLDHALEVLRKRNGLSY